MVKRSLDIERAAWLSYPINTDPKPSSQVEEIRRGLTLAPAELPLTALVPIIVPTSFFESGKWVGPYEVLRATGLGLTWGILMAQQAMRYVDANTEKFWESQSLDWKKL